MSGFSGWSGWFRCIMGFTSGLGGQGCLSGQGGLVCYGFYEWSWWSEWSGWFRYVMGFTSFIGFWSD